MPRNEAVMFSQEDMLDEIIVRKEFNVAEALSSIQFYWNLAKLRGELMVVEVRRLRTDPMEEGG